MDTKLHDTIVRICNEYAYPDELSRARVTKLVYLSDWKMALDHGRQVTSINWVFNHYGPDVPDTVKAADDLYEAQTENAFGAPKVLISASADAVDSLEPSERLAVDEVLAATAPMTFTRFIDYVYESFPIKQSSRYDDLDLVYMAERARAAGVDN